MVTKLAEEIGELRRDRKQHNEGLEKLENFVVHALAREIQEFAQDKRDVVETKVRLVREARGKLEQLKARFIKESAEKIIARGDADAVSFGVPYISNPDLVKRFATDAALNETNFNTFSSFFAHYLISFFQR